jgi:hypothetical protein
MTPPGSAGAVRHVDNPGHALHFRIRRLRLTGRTEVNNLRFGSSGLERSLLMQTLKEPFFRQGVAG